MDLSTLNTKQVGEKMAENYLITGYWGEPHVTVENDRGFNAAVFGTGKFVLPVGEMFRAEYIGNNIVRIYDGKLIDNGAVAGIPAGEYLEFMIPEAGQGMKRNDLIIFEYSRNDSTLVESGTFKVIPGAETSEAAVDPVLTESNLLSNIASFDQMALWRVSVSGAVISNPEILYNTRFAGERIAKASSTDGKTYTANLPGVAKLYTGLEITIIPDTTSTTTLPSMNVNGLGDVNIKRRITSNTRTTVQSEDENFLYEDQPIRVIYNGSVWVADMARANVNDLYGTVPIEKGGTGADNAEEALENLGAIPLSQKGAANGVATLDANGMLAQTNPTESVNATVSTHLSAVNTVDSGTATVKKVGNLVFGHIAIITTVKSSARPDITFLLKGAGLHTEGCVVLMNIGGVSEKASGDTYNQSDISFSGRWWHSGTSDMGIRICAPTTTHFASGKTYKCECDFLIIN